jgi:hypothetical protein
MANKSSLSKFIKGRGLLFTKHFFPPRVPPRFVRGSSLRKYIFLTYYNIEIISFTKSLWAEFLYKVIPAIYTKY